MSYPTASFDNSRVIASLLTPAVDRKYGAPIRCSYGIIDPDADECKYAATKIVLREGYDAGGAYWGVGQTLYCIHTVGSDEVRQFTRADSADAAFDEFEVPMHLRVTVEQQPLTFDCSELGEMDATAILELFDTDQLYTSQVTGSRDGCHEAFAKARSVVKDWVFSPRLYKTVSKWWANLSSDEDDGSVTEQDLRALVLQEMAHLYHELEYYQDEFETSLALFRQVDWTDAECPVDLSIGDDGKIYYCFGS